MVVDVESRLEFRPMALMYAIGHTVAVLQDGSSKSNGRQPNTHQICIRKLFEDVLLDRWSKFPEAAQEGVEVPPILLLSI